MFSRPLCLREELRPLLASRVPRGELVPGLGHVAAGLRYTRLVTVGDMVSRTAFRLGLRPFVAVYDCREMRSSVGCPEPPPGYVRIRARNPRSTIQPEAAGAVREALRRGNAVVEVDGEEDLLALPAILYSDVGVVVAYGQPGEGVVLVQVDQAVKRLAAAILRRLAPCSPAGKG
ncbi:hypothetical protein CF15_00180 [Pyrodictium occultum]|uniref:GTP-dependent dephospho-CoA kinase n=1 Tax=Pyrodictium occultum TaxID=2309 RepID=A0A0V8RTD3_PYROC|nr:GTP-dependent dephospho-CoA kinase family protein [Pyrodictium occultum]KSW11327.1 hypothetical protein CF15_00180 [Pyrodictium occultum]